MPTATTTQLVDCTELLKSAGESALHRPTVEDFIDIERQLGEVDTLTRELQQSLWRNEAKHTIKRLESNEPLTESDREVIRTFVVSDAQHYLDEENNFPDWLREFRRLLTEMDRRAHTVDRESIGPMRGVVKDAVRLIPYIRNYLEVQRRFDRFDLTP